MLTLLTNVLFNTTLSDMETGYKAFRADVLRSLRLTQDDFAIEPEMTGEVCRRKLRIYQLPIAYYGRSYAEGRRSPGGTASGRSRARPGANAPVDRVGRCLAAGDPGQVESELESADADV